MSAYVSGTPTSTEMTLPTAIAIKVENEICEGDVVDEFSGAYNNIIKHAPTFTIKNEPALDIDDTHENGPVTLSASQTVPIITNHIVPQQEQHATIMNGTKNISDNNPVHMITADMPESPKIRLKPSSKLFPSPNPLDPKKRFICPFEDCPKAYGKSSHLRSHLTWHTGVKPFVCKEANCGRGFTRSDELNRHVRTHTGEKPFECIQCGKKFSRSDHLTKHLATHSKQTNSQNAKRALMNAANAAAALVQLESAVTLQEQQPLTFNSNSNMQQQQRMMPKAEEMHKDQQPQQQHLTNGLENNNNNNKDSNHLQFSDGMHFMASLISGNDGLVEAEADELDTLTDEMKATVALKVKLERADSMNEYPHMVPPSQHPHHQHHQQQLQRQYEQNAQNSSPDDIPPELIMPVSTIISPPSPTMTNNLLARPHDPSDDIIMPEANALPFRVDRNVLGKFETAILDPSRPFRCVHCEKCFKRQDDLTRHVRTHTGEKPFACGECSRRFMRGDHLKKHMRMHTKIT